MHEESGSEVSVPFDFLCSFLFCSDHCMDIVTLILCTIHRMSTRHCMYMYMYVMYITNQQCKVGHHFGEHGVSACVFGIPIPVTFVSKLVLSLQRYLDLVDEDSSASSFWILEIARWEIRLLVERPLDM